MRCNCGCTTRRLLLYADLPQHRQQVLTSTAIPYCWIYMNYPLAVCCILSVERRRQLQEPPPIQWETQTLTSRTGDPADAFAPIKVGLHHGLQPPGHLQQMPHMLLKTCPPRSCPLIDISQTPSTTQHNCATQHSLPAGGASTLGQILFSTHAFLQACARCGSS